MRIAYSYLRFSTPEQLEGDSIRRQSAKTRAWCEKRGIPLDTTLTFQDLGRSAFTGSHVNEGALGTFFDLVKNGTVKPGSYLVIESLDRFSRENPMIAAGRLFELVKAGITVVTVDDGQEYSPENLGGGDIAPMLLLVVKLTQAHIESAKKSDRVGEAWRKKKEVARIEMRPITRRCPGWLYIENGQFKRNEERVAIVQRIFEETIAGYGRREIARRLTQEGISPFRAGERNGKSQPGWQTSSIAKIVQDRMVLGEYQPHSGTHRTKNRKPDGPPILNYYPQIIDHETYWRAQDALKDRRQQTAGRRGMGGAHILRGLAKCAVCGGPMHIINKGRPPKGGTYLYCDRTRRGAGCHNRRAWRVKDLEVAIISCIAGIDIKAFDDLSDNNITKTAGLLTAARAELDHLEASRKRLLMLVRETDDEEARAAFKVVAEEIKQKKLQIKELEEEAATAATDPGNIARLLHAIELSRHLEDDDLQKRREVRVRLSAILRKLVDKIECHPVGGAVMIIPQRPQWHVNRLTQPYAYRMEPRGVFMLLEKNPSDEMLEHFFAPLFEGVTHRNMS